MALKLPKPFRESLPRSPLSLVACQLRYSEPEQPLSAARVASLRGRLSERGFEYPKVDAIQLQSLTIDVSQAALPMTAMSKGWRLVSGDSRWIITVTPDNVTLETPRYTAWAKDFEVRLHSLFDAFAEEFVPSVETRLGLRYVDMISEPTVLTAAAWRGLISDRLLGPLSDNDLAESIAVSQQQFTVAINDQIRAVVRHGAFPDPSRDNAYTYLLDTDVFREILLPYEAATVKKATSALHDAALSLFRHFVTDKLFGILKKPAKT